MKIKSDEEIYKKCATCGEEKPLTEYPQYASSKDGKQRKCNKCFHEYNSKKNREHRELSNEEKKIVEEAKEELNNKKLSNKFRYFLTYNELGELEPKIWKRRKSKSSMYEKIKTIYNLKGRNKRQIHNSRIFNLD